jgi:hypothetical protein
MENLWKHLGIALLFITITALIACATYIVMDYFDTDKYKELRNRHRIYDPIDIKRNDDDDDYYISNTQ